MILPHPASAGMSHRCAGALLVCIVAGCSGSPAPDFSPLTVDQLRTKTSDADASVRFAALFELGRRDAQGAAAIKEVTARLTDDHVQVRRVAAQTIGGILMHSSPPYDPDTQAAIAALKANTDTDETVKAGVRIALSVVASREK
jgi:HEAT repeat protein